MDIRSEPLVAGMMPRRQTYGVQIRYRANTVNIGHGAPVVVQSMTNTDTADVDATVRQAMALADAGSELVRMTVNTPEAAQAVPSIRERLDAAGYDVPLVGDFHYNGHLLLMQYAECAQALSKYRINPGNVGQGAKRDLHFAEMIEVACRYDRPVRIGVNWGSLDQGLLERLNHVADSDFGRVTYTEAVQILEKHNDEFAYKVSWGCDLQTEHERYLTETVFKRPVFITDYPKEIKAFYMKQNPDGKTVAAMDCLVPGIGEIIGGSQREENYEKLKNRMEELGLNAEDYEFYLDLRKYGTTRHAGFGLGFERCIMYLTGMSNIRDVIPFPRTVNNCEL